MRLSFCVRNDVFRFGVGAADNFVFADEQIGMILGCLDDLVVFFLSSSDDALFVFLDPLCILDRSWNARAQRIDEFVDFSFVEDDLVFIEQWLLCVFCHEGEFVD